MVEAKGTTTQTKSTVRPKAPASEKSKAASKSFAALSGRKSVAKKDSARTTYAVMAGVAILVVLLLAFALKKKPAAAGGAKTVAKEVTRKAKKAADDVAMAAAIKKRHPAPVAAETPAATPAPKRTSRSAGIRSRQPVASRTDRVRTPKVRRDRTTGSRRTGTKHATGSDELTAIGEGTAMFGKRTVRVGDVIRGRVIREITAEGVRLDYAGTTFSVRIGEVLP
jgi:hypothetical protein